MLFDKFLTNNGKLMTKWVHYFPIYEKHFSRFINQSIVFWEIGVYKGGSLQMWREYFGPFVKIIGIDINSECKAHEEDQIHICIGDQSDTEFLQRVIYEYGTPDIVLDDGSHKMEHIRKTFEFLYPKVNKNGVYLIEDLHAAYYESFGGGLKREGTFIELCKDMIDSLNERHWGNDYTFADSTFSMSFYDSIAVFEKTQWNSDSLMSLTRPEEALDIKFQQITPYSKDKMIKTLSGKNIIVFGAGDYGKLVKERLCAFGYEVSCFVDNDVTKHNSEVKGTKVLSLQETLKIPESVYLISIFDKVTKLSIYKQLQQFGVEEGSVFEFFIY